MSTFGKRSGLARSLTLTEFVYTRLCTISAYFGAMMTHRPARKANCDGWVIAEFTPPSPRTSDFFMERLFNRLAYNGGVAIDEYYQMNFYILIPLLDYLILQDVIQEMTMKLAEVEPTSDRGIRFIGALASHFGLGHQLTRYALNKFENTLGQKPGPIWWAGCENEIERKALAFRELVTSQSGECAMCNKLMTYHETAPYTYDDIILTVCCGQRVCKTPACLVTYVRHHSCKFCGILLIDGEPQFDTESFGEVMARMQLRDAAAIPRGQRLPSMAKMVGPLWESLRVLEASDRMNDGHPLPYLGIVDPRFVGK